MKNQMAFLPVVLCGHLVFATTQDGGNGGLPVPYTPVKASRLQFRCLGRETKLGPLLLPQQITAAGQPLLAAPVRLVTEPDVLGGAKGKSKVAERTAEKPPGSGPASQPHSASPSA